MMYFYRFVKWHSHLKYTSFDKLGNLGYTILILIVFFANFQGFLGNHEGDEHD